MDILLLLLGFFFVCLGIIGAFLPILPGPLTGWVGLFLLHTTKAVPKDWNFLGITLAVAIAVWILDYFIPAMGTKRFGGSKSGVYGTMIGLVIGLISPIPFGILIGAFVGAFVGELLHNSKDTNRALKASFGSFLGFLVSIGLKLSVGIVYFWFYISEFWEFKANFF